MYRCVRNAVDAMCKRNSQGALLTPTEKGFWERGYNNAKGRVVLEVKTHYGGKVPEGLTMKVVNEACKK